MFRSLVLLWFVLGSSVVLLFMDVWCLGVYFEAGFFFESVLFVLFCFGLGMFVVELGDSIGVFRGLFSA